MTFKKTLPAMALMLTLLFAVSAAIAQTPDSGDKKAAVRAGQMSPEDQAAWAELWKEHREKIEPLRDQIWAKQMEYDFLVANPNTKPTDIKAVIDEMLRLKDQMRTERNRLTEASRAKGLNLHKFGPGFMKDWGGHGSEGDCQCPGFGPAKNPGKGHSRHHGGQIMNNG